MACLALAGNGGRGSTPTSGVSCCIWRSGIRGVDGIPCAQRWTI